MKKKKPSRPQGVCGLWVKELSNHNEEKNDGRKKNLEHFD